jgi:hypothetical protein
LAVFEWIHKMNIGSFHLMKTSIRVPLTETLRLLLCHHCSVLILWVIVSWISERISNWEKSANFRQNRRLNELWKPGSISENQTRENWVLFSFNELRSDNARCAKVQTCYQVSGESFLFSLRTFDSLLSYRSIKDLVRIVTIAVSMKTGSGNLRWCSGKFKWPFKPHTTRES